MPDRSKPLKPLPDIVYDDGESESLATWWTTYTREGAGRTNYGFLMVPNLFFRSTMGVGPQAWHVLMVLMSWMLRTDPGRALRRKGGIRISNIMEWTEYSRSTVMRALERLEEVGYLNIHSTNGEAHQYQIDIARVVRTAEALLDYREEESDPPQ